MKGFLRSLVRPKVVIPAVLSAGVIVALFSFADLRKVLAVMAGFQHLYLLFFFLLMIAYEVVRGAQWHYLLGRLGLRVPLRAQIFAFATAEVTKTLPVGNYFQNYVLKRAEGADFGRTSAATTLIIVGEVAVSLVGVVALGLGTWTTAIRIAVPAGVALFAVVIWLVRHLHHPDRRPAWVARHKALRNLVAEYDQFRAGAKDILHPRAMLVLLGYTTAYLLLAGTGLYVVVRGLGISGATYGEALSVYFFSLAFALILPLPMDIGAIEVSGLGAFIAVGVERNAALGAMFVNRILSILSALVIALIIVAALHGELRAVLQDRPRPDRAQRSRPEGDPAREAPTPDAAPAS